MVNYNDHDFQAYDIVYDDSQYAPTPGYSGRRPAFRSDRDSMSCFSEDGVEDQSQLDAEIPRLLQLPEWYIGLSTDEIPASCIQYTIEWKVMNHLQYRLQNV